MMRTAAACVLTCLLLSAGCDRPASGIWLATLSGQPGFESVNGTATGLVEGGGTLMSISIFGATPGSTHPWRIRLGVCGEGGPLFGEHEHYPDLTVRADGAANASASIPAVLESRNQYYINVYETTDLETLIACGSLDKPVS